MNHIMKCDPIKAISKLEKHFFFMVNDDTRVHLLKSKTTFGSVMIERHKEDSFLVGNPEMKEGNIYHTVEIPERQLGGWLFKVAKELDILES